MATGSYITIVDLNSLSEFEKVAFQELIGINKNLTRKCDKVERIDKKINKASKQINRIIPEIKGRSIVSKIGYCFAGTAVALFVCPISWIAGTFLYGSSMTSGVDHDTAMFFYNAPLCGRLFAKAINSKEQWQKKLDKLDTKKTGLEDKRFEIFKDIETLDEQLESQISKITEIGNCSIPSLLHEATLLRQRVRQLAQTETTLSH